jgi:hypothetical protein
MRPFGVSGCTVDTLAVLIEKSFDELVAPVSEQ